MHMTNETLSVWLAQAVLAVAATVVSGVDDKLVMEAIRSALA